MKTLSTLLATALMLIVPLSALTDEQPKSAEKAKAKADASKDDKKAETKADDGKKADKGEKGDKQSVVISRADPKKADAESGLKLSVPKAWGDVTRAPSRLRLAEFAIPAAKGDEEKEKVKLAIFSFGGGGGGVPANIQRWIGQFDGKGRKVKVYKGECEQGIYVLVDITGTFNMSVGPPILRKTKAIEDARMLGLIVGVKEEGATYFLKMGGPAKTVSAQEKALRASIGYKADKEEEIDTRKEE